MNSFCNWYLLLVRFESRFFICVALLCALMQSAGFSQTLVSGNPLRVIQTEYFDIIFPEQSRASAEYIASIADDTLETLAPLLGRSPVGRIPVTISPFTDEFNGYMGFFPYAHIVLYDVAPDVEFTTYRNSLESLFTHELVHVLSLGSRSPAMEFFHGLFGGWVMPTLLSAPLFMVEGVTVSFESLNGYGRSNDPLVRDRLVQARHEGAFLSPAQASGVYDHPPFGRAYYEYGGLFSSWLQKTYGMERYAHLWKELGKFSGISLRNHPGKLGRAFTRVYPVSFRSAWLAFSETFRTNSIVDGSVPVLTGQDLMIESLAGGLSATYILDRYSRSVLSIDPESGRSVSVLKTDATSTGISISSDETTMLVSGYRKSGALSRAVVREYVLDTGKRTGRMWQGVKSPAYFRDGIVALSGDGHATHLVYCPSSGEQVLLLGGNAERLFSNPVPIDETRIAFIVSEQGVRSMGIYHYDTGEVRFFSTGDALDSVVWRYARCLSSSSGELLFSWHDEAGLYRLARISFDSTATASLSLHGIDYSGGIHAPVRSGAHIVYYARLSATDALMRYPGNTPDDAVRTVPLVMIHRDFPVSVSAIGADEPHGFPEKKYCPVAYLNPLQFWIPLPVLSVSGNKIRIDGAGIATYLSTPTDMNHFFLFGGYNFREGLVDTDVVWQSFLFRIPSYVSFTDTIEFLTDDSFEYPYRETRVAASVLFSRGLGSERIQLSVSPSFESLWIALPYTTTGSPYEWEYLDAVYIPGLMAGLSCWDRLPWELFGRGAELYLYGRSVYPDADYRTDAVFRLSPGFPLPFRLTVYGVWDETGLDLDGSSVVFGNAPWSNAAAVEYADEQTDMHCWLAGGELELQLFAIDIQKSISSLYVNRVFMILGWRAVAFDVPDSLERSSLPGHQVSPDARIANSLVLKTGAVMSILAVPMIPVRMAPHGWIAWKLADGDPFDLKESIVFGLSFQVEW